MILNWLWLTGVGVAVTVFTVVRVGFTHDFHRSNVNLLTDCVLVIPYKYQGKEWAQVWQLTNKIPPPTPRGKTICCSTTQRFIYLRWTAVLRRACRTMLHAPEKTPVLKVWTTMSARADSWKVLPWWDFTCCCGSKCMWILAAIFHRIKLHAWEPNDLRWRSIQNERRVWSQWCWKIDSKEWFYPVAVTVARHHLCSLNRSLQWGQVEVGAIVTIEDILVTVNMCSFEFSIAQVITYH